MPGRAALPLRLPLPRWQGVDLGGRAGTSFDGLGVPAGFACAAGNAQPRGGGHPKAEPRRHEPSCRRAPLPKADQRKALHDDRPIPADHLLVGTDKLDSKWGR